MRRTRLPFSRSVLAGFLLLLMAGGSAAALQQDAAAQRERLAARDPAATFFGYEPGEERLYRIGPPDSLAAGEEAEWRIRFAELQDHPVAGTVARMEIEHHRFELVPGTWGPAEELMEVAIEGHALLGLDGFPLEVDYLQRFLLRGESAAEDARRRIRFVYDPESERYDKFLEVGRREWDFHFALPGSDEVDKEALRGLFLYRPSALACIGSSRSTCISQEPAFSNPGLLSLVLPYLLEEAESERHFHFFMPAGIADSPFYPTDATRWLSQERDNFGNQDRYFERWRLKLGASEDIEVGPRTMHAWEIDLGGGIDRVWIEPSGRVLKVELETTMDNTDDRYIRLVFPHEEFLSPNDDPAEECCG